MIHAVWSQFPAFNSSIDTDVFVVMANHFHGILFVGATPSGCPLARQKPDTTPMKLSLPDVVHRFKTLTTKRYTDGVKRLGWPRFIERLWQRNYYEHVIRNDESLNCIREYIVSNPLRWDLDPENPDAKAQEPSDIWRTDVVSARARATSRSPLHNRQT